MINPFASLYSRVRRIWTRKKADSDEKTPKTKKTILFQDGVALIAVGVLLVFSAAARGVNLLLALGAMFVGFLWVDRSVGEKTLRNLRARRKLPDSIYVDEPFYVEIEVDATERRASAWAIVVEDKWAPEESSFDAPSELKEASARARDERLKREAEEKNPKIRRKKPKKNAKLSDMRLTEEEASALVDARQYGDAIDSPVVYFPAVKRGTKMKEYYVGVMTRRGRRRLESLTLSTRFPCGFFRSSEVVAAPAETIVFPKMGVLTREWRSFVGAVHQESSIATGRTSRAPDETVAIRDWRVGDSKRTIAWRATAKRERLQTREFARRQTRSFVVILDLYARRPEEYLKSDEWLKLEAAVSFVATLANRWSGSDARMEFAVNAREEAEAETAKSREWNEIIAGASVRRVMTRLALAQPTDQDALRDYLDDAATRNERNAQVVVVSLKPVDPERLVDPKTGGDFAARLGESAVFIDASADSLGRYFQFESDSEAR